VTNPYDARLGGIRIVGHSGQPLEDLARYTACSTVMTPGDEVGMWLRPAGAGTGAMEVEEAAEGAAEVEARRRRLAALRSIEEDGDGEGGGEVVDAAIAAAVSGTSKDKTMGAIVGTGAGGGAEERALAVGDGSFIASRLSRLDLLHNTLLWRHLAPTAPDTLSCYPFRDDDPFILHSDAMPHVLFAGRQAAFATRFVAHPTGGVTRLICVPDFATTGTAVLLDLASLEATPLAFAFGGLESLRAAIKG
jgi:DNA polymerase II small subunit/DNA polymerase delta subunit B